MSLDWGANQPSAMSALVGRHDWASTPLGPLRDWSHPLDTSVKLCLAAEFPLALWWGPRLVQIYNDPFRRAIGEARHASGFAAPLASGWPDLWPVVGPAVERLGAGEPTVKLRHVPLLPGGGTGGFFAMSLSPVLRPDGSLGGVLAGFREAVPWENVEQSYGFLLDLHEALRGAGDRDAAVGIGCERLCAHLKLASAGFAVLRRREGTGGTVWPEWREGAPRAVAREFRLKDFSREQIAAWDGGRPFFPGEGGKGPENPWDGAHREAQMPAREEGRLAALVFARAGEKRRWSRLDLDLLSEAGRMTAEAVERAGHEAELRRCRETSRAVIDSLGALPWRAGADGGWTWASAEWSEATGLARGDSLGRGWLDAVHPEDRVELEAAWRKARLGASRFTAEARIAGGGAEGGEGGSFRWFRLEAVPMEEGGAAEWFGLCTDVEEVHALRHDQARLKLEGHRRAQRTLGLVRALVRRGGEERDAGLHLGARLDAFARVQAVVSVDPEGEVDLDFLVAEELAAHGVHESGPMRMEGPAVRLRISSAQAIGLAVHELAAHAVDSGALTHWKGRLRIGWVLDAEGREGRELRFTWNEADGSGKARHLPDLTLLTRMLAQEMRGQTALNATPGGFSCTVTLPFPERSRI